MYEMTRMPKDKQKVYALLADGTIAVHYWSSNTVETNMFLQGNIFEDKGDAKLEQLHRHTLMQEKIEKEREKQCLKA